MSWQERRNIRGVGCIALNILPTQVGMMLGTATRQMTVAGRIGKSAVQSAACPLVF